MTKIRQRNRLQQRWQQRLNRKGIQFLTMKGGGKKPFQGDQVTTRIETKGDDPKTTYTETTQANFLKKGLVESVVRGGADLTELHILVIVESMSDTITREDVILAVKDRGENLVPRDTGDAPEIVVLRVLVNASTLNILTPMIPTMISQLLGETCI